MRAKAIAAVLALGAIALCALPAAASAKARHYVITAQRFATIQQLRGTNGFRFSVIAFGKKVDVTAEKLIHPDGVVSADYSVPRRGSLRDGLDLRLGREGRFDLHFVDHKTKEEPLTPNCKGAPEIVEEGVFVGSIHFHGLRGFTRLDATRAPGTILKQGRQVCVRQKVRSN